MICWHISQYRPWKKTVIDGEENPLLDSGFALRHAAATD